MYLRREAPVTTQMVIPIGGKLEASVAVLPSWLAMPAARSPEELRAAVDSMFRIRAVESPPDDQGLRKVWHRGALHAELVSEIDLAGEVARHEFTLFDDVVVWERGKGFSTGESEGESSTRGSATVHYDTTNDPARMSRVASALTPYAGRDRIIQHLRELVLKTQAGVKPVRSLGVVTGSNPAAPPPVEPPKPVAPPASRMPLVLVGVGLVVIVVAILFFALK